LLQPGPSSTFLWELDIVHQLLSVPPTTSDEVSERFCFLNRYITTFRNCLREQELFQSVEFSLLHSEAREAICLMAVIVNCPHGFEVAVEKGMSCFMIKWMENNSGNEILEILNVFALNEDFCVFENSGFFRWFMEFVTHADESGIVASVRLAYLLEPIFVEDLIECGFVRMILEMIVEVSFEVFMPICEFIGLVLMDLPAGKIQEVIGELEMEGIARILDVGDSKIILRALELLMTLCEGDPEYFSWVSGRIDLDKQLETLMEGENILVRQHSLVLLQSVD
jgi:hypothetical protein